MPFDMNQYLIFLLAVARVTGVIFFNPIFGRKGVPNTLKIGLSLVLALYASYSVGNNQVINYTVLEFIGALLIGFVFGMIIGFIMQLFLSIFQIGGQLIDLQIGLSMATMFDPSSKSNVSLSGNLFTTMYIMLFFISNSHLAFMTVVVKSFQIIPLGIGGVSERIGVYFVELFYYILIYALQVALPVIVIELISEFAVGILMRLVPNIQIFVINFQLKIIIGLLVLFTIIPSLAKFMTQTNMIMMEKITQVLTFFT